MSLPHLVLPRMGGVEVLPSPIALGASPVPLGFSALAGSSGSVAHPGFSQSRGAVDRSATAVTASPPVLLAAHATAVSALTSACFPGEPARFSPTLFALTSSGETAWSPSAGPFGSITNPDALPSGGASEPPPLEMTLSHAAHTVAFASAANDLSWISIPGETAPLVEHHHATALPAPAPPLLPAQSSAG